MNAHCKKPMGERLRDMDVNMTEQLCKDIVALASIIRDELRAIDIHILPLDHITERDLAAFLRRPIGSLRNWRALGIGPRFDHMGGDGQRITYTLTEVAKWLIVRQSDEQ